jgi:hypothetical protein
MSDAELNTFLQQFTRAMIDPTAPLPDLWPTGAMGVFLIFVTQIGLGIPSGVLRARDAGLSPFFTAGLYAASDVILAFTIEPMLLLLRWLSPRVDFIARLGRTLSRFSGASGLSDGKVRGPLGLILFSFAVAPAPARAASEAAGHGFISGWTLAIIGDMLYFWLVMASTLWVSSVLGDDRLAIGAVLIGTWVLPLIIRRMRGGSAVKPARPRPAVRAARVAPALVVPAGASAAPAGPTVSASSAPRKRTPSNARRRSTRGLHR